MIDYDDLRVSLSQLIDISDMALVTDDRNSTYSTLAVINTLLEQLVNRLDERELHD